MQLGFVFFLTGITLWRESYTSALCVLLPLVVFVARAKVEYEVSYRDASGIHRLH